MTGAPPPIQIIAHRLSEEAAFQLEAALIKVLQTDGNLVAGKYAANFGLSVGEVEGSYANPLLESQLGHRVLLVSLNGGPDLPSYPEIQEADMPRRILGRWPISGPRADEVEYIIGVYRQLTRVVFKIEQGIDGKSMHKRVRHGTRKNGKPNWKRIFHGAQCPKMEAGWADRRIVNACGNVLTKFPIRMGTRIVGARLRCG